LLLFVTVVFVGEILGLLVIGWRVVVAPIDRIGSDDFGNVNRGLDDLLAVETVFWFVRVFVVGGRIVIVGIWQINFNYRKKKTIISFLSLTRGDFDMDVVVFVCVFLTIGDVRYGVCVDNLSWFE